MFSTSEGQVLSNDQTAEPSQLTEEAPVKQNGQVQSPNSSPNPTPTQTFAGSPSQSQATPLTSSETAPAVAPTQTTSPNSASTLPVQTSQQIAASTDPNVNNAEATPSSPTQSASAPTDISQQAFTLTSDMEHAILRNLHALSIMQPTQLADLLQSNPQLQAVLAAMNQAKPAAS